MWCIGKHAAAKQTRFDCEEYVYVINRFEQYVVMDISAYKALGGSVGVCMGLYQ